MLDEPAGQLQRLGSHIADVTDAADFTLLRFATLWPRLAEPGRESTFSWPQ